MMIEACLKSLKINQQKMLCKNDIMEIYNCESNKALRILKLMFQMGYGNKIGKEYYISQKSQEDFIEKMAGKEVYIWYLKAFGGVTIITFNYHFLKWKNEKPYK